MPSPAARLAVLALCLLAAACSSPTRSLPKYERPLARTQFQNVRTTAYTHTEGDHLQYSNRNACGGRLQSGSVKSAACDWSRWPVGTIFRIRETGETFIVDDYGWALSGTNTIDLYKTSRAAMNAWGVRRVQIELLQWGDVRRSLAILGPRMKHAHVRRMVKELKSRSTELSRPLSFGPVNAVAVEPPPAAELSESVAAESAVRRVAVAERVGPGGFVPPAAPRAALVPFSAGASR